jgi:hypothetical protein
VPEDDHWRQYGELFKTTRTPLIINLNLARKNTALDADMIRAAQRFLPPSAVMSFELGNEPDGWKERYKLGRAYGFRTEGGPRWCSGWCASGRCTGLLQRRSSGFVRLRRTRWPPSGAHSAPLQKNNFKGEPV